MALALTVGGLAALLVGVAMAHPILFGQTAGEYATARRGRTIAVAATTLLTVAAALVAARGRPGRAVIVALPGLVCTALVLARSPAEGGGLFVYPFVAVPAFVAAIPRPESPA